MAPQLARLFLLAAAGILAGVQAGSAAAQSSAPTEVTVTASREALAPRVLKFVNQIAVRQNDEGLPRWQDPVCPLITGLPRQEGEFTLGRISQIATAAKVPLAGEHCRPNLFIFVTTQPTQLLKAMENQKHGITFGDATPTVIDEFIKTQLPVRVWYSTMMRTPDGTPPNPGLPNAAQLVGGSSLGAPTFNDLDRTSHILLSKIWSLSYVIEVVDQARLQAVSRGQFADYVAMVGLADIKPGAHMGDAQTILRLFDGEPQAAPDGLSDWDQAFLKALYATEQALKTQRGSIAKAIVRDVVQK
jgi:hypothetical protein